MSNVYRPTDGLRGMYHDVLRDAAGRVVWDGGWRKNTIVADCRRLLAALMKGGSNALGIQGLQVGSGLDTWDQAGTMPVASPSTTKLADPKPPFTVKAGIPNVTFQMAYLLPNSATTTNTPTNRLQIIATLGPNVPDWPKNEHPSSTLREFGLVAQLEGAPVLVNYVIHPAIPKDPASTLERTIWLVF